MSVFIGRFVGPVRALVPVVAGMFGVTPLRFTIANVLSAIGWAPIYMLPGIILGAASLELPPDMATHVVVSLLLITLLIILCLWLLKNVFFLIHNRINQFLDWIWESLKKSRHFHIFTTLLKHHDATKIHHQLILVFYLLITSTLFLALMIYMMYVNPKDIRINDVAFHLFRSLHTPLLDQIMVAITLVGEKKIILSFAGILFAWLAITKRWYSAWHVLALTILTGGTVEIVKLLTHTQRPWGIVKLPSDFSFPSGHTAITTVLFIGLFLLLSNIFKIKRRGFLFTLFALFILIESLSRLYVGDHWFTDVVGGWLLSAAALIFITLSYNRRVEPNPIKGHSFLLVTILSFIVLYTFTFHRDYHQKFADTKQLDWPTYSISFDSWWQHTNNKVPLYRLNRFGFAQQIINLQWVGSFTNINEILLKNGWESPPERNWISILQRIADVKSYERLPLVSPLYLDKKPVLVLIKHNNGDKKFIVLRLWESNFKLDKTSLPLWVGAVEVIPRTYGWLFKKKNFHEVTLTPDLLFNKVPTDMEVKQVMVITNKGKETTIFLIKPRSLKNG
jgi:membrane-associated phospholipid phosphatase